MKKEAKKVRGVFERVYGSGEWWIRYTDAEGSLRREKAGTKSAAIDLYKLRKADALRNKKLPQNLRSRVVRFNELAQDAEMYCKANNRGQQFDLYRIARLKTEFGSRPAAIPIEDIRKWFSAQEWTDGTYNRYRTTLSLIYRLGIEHRKVENNPAKLLRRRAEDNDRVRFLDQYTPSKTELEYLQSCVTEEARLRAVILKKYADHMPEFEIALHTGIRPSEQYALDWSRVDLGRKFVTLNKTKNGKSRQVPLNAVSLAAFRSLRQRSLDGSGPVFVNMHGEPLRGYKHWFNPAVEEAGLKHFTWYCLRHTFASRLAMAAVDLRTIARADGARKERSDDDAVRASRS